MKNSLLDQIKKAFPSVVEKDLSDEYIRTHTDPMWDTPPIPLIRAIPLYMLWCVEHSSEENELIFDYTISALNKYARAKTPDIEWQNFRFHCTPEQIEAVKAFLYWCQTSLSHDYEPTLSRAIKNWESIS